MDKKLKRVQNGAAFAFVVLKILRILLLVLAVLLVAALVFLALVNENSIQGDAIQRGVITVDLSELGLSNETNLGSLVQAGVLSLPVREVKMVLLLLAAAALLVAAVVYVQLLLAGRVFKHMRDEETPFTRKNVRLLRLLGILSLIFWVGEMVLSYVVSQQLILRLGLPFDQVSVSLNLATLAGCLLILFLSNLFSLAHAQQEALKAAQAQSAPVAPTAHIAPEPAAVPAAPAVAEPPVAPAAAAEPEAPAVPEIPGEPEAPAVPEMPAGQGAPVEPEAEV